MARNNETVVTRIPQALAEGGAAEPSPGCLVVFYGENIGRRIFLTEPEQTIGRADSAAIQVDQESTSRLHASLRSAAGRSWIRDLGSTNGTFVNNVRVEEGELRDGDLLRIGQTIFKYLSGNNIESKYHEEIYRLSTIDGLTETYNKRYFLDALERELNRAQRYGRRMCLALFDLDHFKRVNDTHGHLAGDYVLRELAALVGQNIRRQDILARYGGEEFAIILPELEEAAALQVCEKLRHLVDVQPFQFGGTPLHITVSIGVGSFPGATAPATADALIAAVDARLYAAKQGGRNRVAA